MPASRLSDDTSRDFKVGVFVDSRKTTCDNLIKTGSSNKGIPVITVNKQDRRHLPLIDKTDRPHSEVNLSPS